MKRLLSILAAVAAAPSVLRWTCTFVRNLPFRAAPAAVLALAAITGASTAFATDLPAKQIAPVKAAAAVAPSAFFVGAGLGMGWANQQYQGFTLPGDVSGNFYPTGALLGLTAGAGATFGGLYAELYADIDYRFARASQSGVDSLGNSFTAIGKNGLELRQGLFVGAAIPTIAGAFPVQTSVPASGAWPIPVTVPTSLNMANIVIGPDGGVVESHLKGCIDEVATTICAQRWIAGPYIGAQMQFAVTPNSKIRVKYYHDFLNAAWTQTGGASVLGAFRVINADTAKVEWTYNF